MMMNEISENTIETTAAHLADWAMRFTASKGEGVHPTGIPQLEIMRDDAPVMNACVYEPSFAIIVQGKKEIFLGETSHKYGVGQYLVVSVELPFRGFVLEAETNKPFLGFLLKLSPRLLYDIVTEVRPEQTGATRSWRGMYVGDIDRPLIDCVVRLTQLIDSPDDIPFLAPMVVREMYYRLLMGEHGGVIRQIATAGSQSQRIVDVIEAIKSDITQTIRVEELAEEVNMSTSSFHRHFKAVTSMSPLQYQKQLRLIEARRLMLTEDSDAARAAYQVGYESPSQFSREYSRLFGAPPIQDIQRLRV